MVILIFSIISYLYFDKIPYFCNRTVFARLQLSLIDVFFQDNRVGNLRRAECSEVIYLTYLHESGLWVGEQQSRHNGRRLSTLCLRRTEIQQIHGNIIVLNVVNGRCPGCDYINPVETCKHGLYPFGRSLMFYIGLFTDMIFISAWALTLSVRQ